MPKPWKRIKLYCESGKPEYFTCEVYNTLREMEQAIMEMDPQEVRLKAHAMVICYTRCSDRNDWGTIFFYKQFIPPSVLSHEFFHAALSWAQRRRLKLKPCGRHAACPGEERAACVAERLMYQFYAKQKGRMYYICGSDLTYKDIQKAAA